ncbi:MAG TPA: PHB depolymerase family esterase [Mycobacteriales bacterium]|nr:PHB depolymerase family esterase [Mycobacteriales bacterium]
MKRILAAVAVVLAASVTGCIPVHAATTSLRVGRSTQVLVVDGMVRTVHFYRPAGISGPAPLVVMLHGGYGSGTQAETSYNWDAAADRGHFIAAFPDGYLRSWNAGGTCCGPAAKRDVDDVGFIRAVVQAARARAPIDPARIFAAGMSNGAIMAYRLACQTRLFDAVASVAGTMLVSCGDAAPTSILEIHGTADRNVPYDGGPGQPALPVTQPIDGPSVPDNDRSWRAIDGCVAPDLSTVGPVTTSLASCPGGRAVELVSVAGAGHQWPGGNSSPLAQRALGLDPPSAALDATATIWEFFAAHP